MNNENELVEKMIRIVEEFVREYDKDQFDENKQNASNKFIATKIITELDKVIKNEN
ncbi:MAG TPA: hypothetical protein GX708_04780 [Gallicola sp.]|nr:hypothetical protein [Gallicola sp.]